MSLKYANLFDQMKYAIARDSALAPGSPPLKVLIVSTWRSGSKFLGSLLASHPGTFYSMEPLRFEGSVQDQLGLLTDIFRCQFATHQDYVTYTKTFRYGWDNTQFHEYCMQYPPSCTDAKFLQKVCPLFPVNLIKTVRLPLADAERLIRDTGVKVIYLVRDPRGVMESRWTAKWCQDPCHSTQECNRCADELCQLYTANLRAEQKLAKQYPERYVKKL